MPTRSLFAFAAASMLFACSVPSTTGTNVTGGDTKGSTADGDKKDDSSDSATAASTTAGHAVDGTWDVTAMGDGPTGASQLTIKGGQIDGLLIGGHEGQSEGTADDGNGGVVDCTVTKDRVTVSVTITGDTMTGTFTSDFEMTNPDQCGAPSSGTSKVTGTRTKAAKNAAGQTAAEGDWVITPDANDSAQPFAVSVAGMVGSIFDTAQKGNKLFDVTVKSGQATASGSSDVTFAARKR